MDQARLHTSELNERLDVSLNQARSLESRLQATKNDNKKLLEHTQARGKKIEELESVNKFLKEINTEAISKIKEECALLPSVIEWSSSLQEMVYDQIVASLVNRPALKAAEEVKEARATARNWKRQADTFKNRVSLYELEAPWLIEYLDYTVEDIVEGLHQEEKLQQSFSSGTDPLRLFVSESEWAVMSELERNQLALDRYLEYRQRNAWAAGIQYERYIGFSYEKQGFNVFYQGALKGVSDLANRLGMQKIGRRHQNPM